MQCAGSPFPLAARAGLLFADGQLHAVLGIWALCWLAMGIYLHQYGVPLPWADEWNLTEVATGSKPLTFEWLWQPANEHRAPLTRLEILVIGRLAGWDMRYVHYFNLALLGAASLTLILAVRLVRGQSALSDVFLALLVLNPWQFQTILFYAYAYAMALACLCLAMSAVVTSWPLRSTRNLLLFFALVLTITFSGGPAGNIWALGLCGVVLRGRHEGKPRCWKQCGLLAAGLVTACSIIMLALIPMVHWGENYQSDSLWTTLLVSSMQMVCWLGAPAPVLWPWGLAVLVIPTSYLGYRLGRDALLARSVDLSCCRPAADLAFVFLATLAVAVIIGYGRGRYPLLWSPRYFALMAPVGLLLYLLLVKLRAPALLPGSLAIVMAICTGWSWPGAIEAGRDRYLLASELVHALGRGTDPLSVLSERYAHAVGSSRGLEVLNALLELRRADTSIFKKQHPRPGTFWGWTQVWEAETGKLGGAFELVDDPEATGNTAVLAAGNAGGAMVTFEVEVPADGAFELCCRVKALSRGQVLAVAVDGGPEIRNTLEPRTEFLPWSVSPLFELSAGVHTLVVSWTPGTRLDLLEIIPRRRGLLEE